MKNVKSMVHDNIDTKSFNQPLLWKNRVNDMTEMFCNTESFNQPLNSWDVSSVTNMLYV